MADRLIGNVAAEYPDYLRDESRRSGQADSISFPRTETELIEDLLAARAQGRRVTVQAARTGITGGAVPAGGHVLNLSRMAGLTGLRRGDEVGQFVLTVQPGLLLADLREALAKREFDTAGWSAESRAALDAMRSAPHVWFPPDPTETSAALGGMVACNASGAQSFFYGPTRKYIAGLRVVLADGATLALRRGEHRAAGRAFELRTEQGGTLTGVLPDYKLPEVKNAAGYFAADDMDLVDLFIGSEGTLGVFSSIDLRLVPEPAVKWGVTSFLPSEDAALDFVERVRHSAAPPVAVELFNCDALDLLRRQREQNPAFKELPELAPHWHTAVYVEFHGPDEASVEEAVMGMTETMLACGGDDAATWLASDAREMQRLKAFRHAIPEAVNLLIDERRKQEPQLTKLGTDLAVPDHGLREMMGLYREALRDAGLESVIFGHIGDNHVHVNIIPRDLNEYARGRQLYQAWARKVIGMGGTVSAEHGIGKLKTALLAEMYGAAGIEQMKALKKALDPDGMLNPGNLFDAGD